MDIAAAASQAIKTPPTGLRAALKVFLLIFTATLTAFCLFQEKMTFKPLNISGWQPASLQKIGGSVEEVSLYMKDGTKLNGWFVKNNQNNRANLLIYFGGTAEELSLSVNNVRKFENWSAVFINYRGYGLSEGIPSEANLYSDALEIYDHFANRKDVDNSKIIVMGRSLGAGIAAHAAYNRNPAAVILVSPYESITNVAKIKYPAFIVDLFLKNKFDLLSLSPLIKAPALILIAADDALIPPEHSRKIAQKWGGEVIVQEVSDADHISIENKKEYWQGIHQFLKSFE